MSKGHIVKKSLQERSLLVVGEMVAYSLARLGRTRVVTFSLVASHQGVSKATARRAIRHALEEGVLWELTPREKEMFGLWTRCSWYTLADEYVQAIYEFVDKKPLSDPLAWERLLIALQMWENFEGERGQS